MNLQDLHSVMELSAEAKHGMFASAETGRVLPIAESSDRSGINGCLPAARVPSIYSVRHLTLTAPAVPAGQWSRARISIINFSRTPVQTCGATTLPIDTQVDKHHL